MQVISKRMQKLGTIWRTVWTYFTQWLMDPRILLVGVLCIFSKTMVSDALISRASEYGAPLHFFEPFIAMGNSGVLVMFFPFVFLILISDFPVINPSTLFILKRTGRSSWLFSQSLLLCMNVITFLLVMLLFSCSSVLGHAEWSDAWSNVTTKYESAFSETASSFVSQYLPSNLYNQLMIYEAMTHTLLLLALYLFLLGMILMLFKLLAMRTAGIFSAIAIIGIGTAACAVNTPAMWAFPMANSIIWEHYDQIASEPIYPLWASYFYFVVGILALMIASHIIINRANVVGLEA